MLVVVLSLLLSTSLAAEPSLDKHVIPLYGNATLGYYYANIYVGTPPQEQSVIIDTGSGQLALPCSKCTNCGNKHIHLPFKLTDSTTSKILTCVSYDPRLEFLRITLHQQLQSERRHRSLYFLNILCWRKLTFRHHHWRRYTIWVRLGWGVHHHRLWMHDQRD